jgi:hypothetical protein
LHFGLFWVRDLASGPLRLLHPQGQQQKPSAKSESDTSSFVSMLLEHCERPVERCRITMAFADMGFAGDGPANATSIKSDGTDQILAQAG